MCRNAVDDAEIIPTLRKDSDQRNLDPKRKRAAKGHGSELHHDIDAEQDKEQDGTCSDDIANGGCR